MSNPPLSTFEDLLADLMDGDITDQDRIKLRAILKNDPSLLKILHEQLSVSELLSQQLEIRQSEHVLSTLEDHLTSLGHKNEDAFIDNVFQRIRKRRHLYRYAAAAIITICLVPLAWFVLRAPAPGHQPGPTQPVVAQAFILNSKGHPGPRKMIRSGQTVTLEKAGVIMQMKFDNGAVVAIESPATFTIESGTCMRLLTGKLNAWCPETAHGFQVKTNDTLLTDLGTSFGVEATKDGLSDFMVIEGSINLRKGRQAVNLVEGNAVTTNSSTGLEILTFEPSRFGKTWALTSGIIATTGAVVPAKPDTPERLARLRNDKEVMVVPEAQGIPFDSPIKAEITDPGHLQIMNTSISAKNLKPNPQLLLYSYLLRVDPKSDLKPPNPIHFEGSVTFDKDVIAIICRRETLSATDQRFTNGKWPKTSNRFYNNLRGLEGFIEETSDEVTLSKDRRTVTISFNTAHSTDDIRVITAE